MVALEEPGPWGARALTESRLDPQVGGALEERCLDARGRALLVRPVDVRRGLGERRRFFLAGGFGHTPWLLAGTVSHPAELLDLPLASLADADRVPSTGDGWPAQDLGGLLLVCANGRRDLCCARRGRAVAARCAARRPGRVWESSHLGGHRFAPTALLLPTGQSLARVTPDLAASALDAAASGRLALGLGPWHDRGRLHLDPGAQVADAAVRHATGESDPGALRVAPAGPEAFDVGHVARAHPRLARGRPAVLICAVMGGVTESWGCFDAGCGEAVRDVFAGGTPQTVPTKQARQSMPGPTKLTRIVDLCGPNRRDTPGRGGRSDKGLLTRVAFRRGA